MAFPRLSLVCNKELAEKQRYVTITQIGVRETGKNAGEVEKYLRSVGLPNGSPYCAAGIYWSFDTAKTALHNSNIKIPIPKTGLANAILVFAKRRGVLTTDKLKTGDLVVWRKTNSIFGHIGQVYTVCSSGWVTTVEYNTGSNNQRDGDGVYMKRRNLLHPLGRMKVSGTISFRS